MHIEFDAAKNEANIASRGLSFDQVAGGIRIISFRKANTREIRNYEQAFAPD